jgi:hypothetical protein
LEAEGGSGLRVDFNIVDGGEILQEQGGKNPPKKTRRKNPPKKQGGLG